LFRLTPKDQLDLIRKKIRRKVKAPGKDATSGNGPAPRLANPMSDYFPGPDFQPKIFRGRVSVFRARKQPLNRIHDKELGWRRMAAGGVDLHYVPGKHGASILREPHVQVLAAELKQCLLK